VASLSQGRTAAAQCGLFTHKSVPVIFEPPCTIPRVSLSHTYLPIIKRENTIENTDAYPINERQTQNKHLTELKLRSQKNICCFHCAAQFHSGFHVYIEVCKVRLCPYIHNTLFSMTNTRGQAAWKIRFIVRNVRYYYPHTFPEHGRTICVSRTHDVVTFYIERAVVLLAKSAVLDTVSSVDKA